MSIVLFAVSSLYAAEAWESARRAGRRVIACVVNRPEIAVPPELDELISVSAVTDEIRWADFMVPLVTPGHRFTATGEAASLGFRTPATLVDPTAIVAESATLAPGSYVNAGAIVASGVTVGASCMLNRGASVGHHTLLEPFASIGPGVTTGGACHIGRGAFIGVGATVAPEVTIGANAVVGAGAVVIRDVADGEVVVGNPARAVRQGRGYQNATVPPLA